MYSRDLIYCSEFGVYRIRNTQGNFICNKWSNAFGQNTLFQLKRILEYKRFGIDRLHCITISTQLNTGLTQYSPANENTGLLHVVEGERRSVHRADWVDYSPANQNTALLHVVEGDLPTGQTNTVLTCEREYWTAAHCRGREEICPQGRLD